MEDPHNNEKGGILLFFIISCGKNVNVYGKIPDCFDISSRTVLRGSSWQCKSKI